MSTEKIEAAVQKAARAIQDLAKAFERHPQTAEAVSKSFAYLALTTNAAQTRAQAAAVGPSGKFSLDMDLPAPIAAQIGVLAPIAPTPALLFPPGTRAPTRSGLTVEQVGGRLVAEARGTNPANAALTGADFIDDDEDGPPGKPDEDDSDVIFVDD